MVEKIATLSYAIYLIHKITITVTQNALEQMGFTIESNYVFLCCLITTFGAAFLIHIIIEKPFIKVKNRILIRINNQKETK